MWAPEAFQVFWGRENVLVPNGIRTPDRPARKVAPIPTELSPVSHSDWPGIELKTPRYGAGV